MIGWRQNLHLSPTRTNAYIDVVGDGMQKYCASWQDKSASHPSWRDAQLATKKYASIRHTYWAQKRDTTLTPHSFFFNHYNLFIGSEPTD